MADHVKKEGKSEGFFGRIIRFFKDTKGEMKKVTWPTKGQVLNNTFVVLMFVFVAGICIWSFDFVMAELMNLIMQNV